MANAVIGALRVVLGMDSAAFEKGAGRAESRMQRFQKKIRASGQRLAGTGARISAGLTAPLIALAYKSVDAQKAQERAVKSVATALESMGDGAGYSLEQLQAMASQMQDKSLYGDEEILSKVTANLLTFGNVTGDVFKRAQQSALDLSARLGQDLQSSAVMLGKALNDPVQGLSALSRVGVSFTEQQKEQIKAMAKAGDVAGAQALMLSELEKQYSGQAQAMASVDSGRITQAMNSIGDAMERVGAIILPILADLADHVKRAAERFSALEPDTQKMIVIAGGLAAAIGPLVAGFGLMVMAMAPLAGIVAAILSPLGLLVTAIVGLGAAIAANWDTVREKFPAIAAVVEGAIDGLKAAFSAFVGSLDDIWIAVLTGAEALATGLELVLQGDFAAIWDGAVNVVRNFANNVVSALGNLLDRAKAAALEIGRNIIDGLKSGISERWEDIKAYIHSLAMELPEWIRKPLGIHSPSRVFARIGGFIAEGLANGIASGVAGVRKAVDALRGATDMDNLSDAGKQARETLRGVASEAETTFGQIGNLIGSSIAKAKSWREALGGVLQSFGQILMRQGQASLTKAAGGSGSFFGGLVSGILGGLAGFASGGSFDVGGAGGIDSQLVAFKASPNETVHITKPGQTVGDASGGGVVELNLRTDPGVIVEIARKEANVKVTEGMQAMNAALPDRVTEITNDMRKR